MIKLTEQYVTTEAEKKAQDFISKVDKNQIRKFYDDFKLIERKITENQQATNEWFKKEILPHIKFVKSKIAYSAGRKSGNKSLVSIEFKKYMDEQINLIENILDFKHFMMHYQAIIAYYTYYSEVGSLDASNKNFQQHRSR
ncbi:MAG: type III-A CRISPR-associated protein Csm2 [Spirochaetes bacterium]|nr:type III-A CRISPR-associated protein Csm2 [Spirochaetota bacterium]